MSRKGIVWIRGPARTETLTRESLEKKKKQPTLLSQCSDSFLTYERLLRHEAATWRSGVSPEDHATRATQHSSICRGCGRKSRAGCRPP